MRGSYRPLTLSLSKGEPAPPGYVGERTLMSACSWFDKLTTSGSRLTTSGSKVTTSGSRLTTSGRLAQATTLNQPCPVPLRPHTLLSRGAHAAAHPLPQHGGHGDHRHQHDRRAELRSRLPEIPYSNSRIESGRDVPL